MNNRLCLLILAFIIMGISTINAAEYSFDLGGPGTQSFHYGSMPTSAVQGDLDNDGIMDVAVGTDDSPAGYLGKCFILWGGTDYQELLNIAAETTVIAIEDLDNNGYKDIICRERTFYNQGNRTFIRAEDEGFHPTSKFADLNGDGILDSVTGAYWRDGSDGTRHEFSSQIDQFEIIDMNDDGRLDIVCKGLGVPRFFWYENTGGEPLYAERQIIDEEIPTTLGEIIDYDYDGDKDLLVRREGIIGVMSNNSGLIPVNYSPLFEVVPEGIAYTNTAIDIDFDGDWDLFGYNSDKKRFYIVEQVGFRSMNFKFKWISEEVAFSYVTGYFLHQNAGKTYYYFREMSHIGVDAKGGLYRTPVNVQAENAVSCNWELLQ